MIGKLTKAFSTATLLATSSASGGVSTPAVYLVCETDTAGLCTALASILDLSVKDRAVELVSDESRLPTQHHLAVRFVPETQSADILSGHLSWTRPDGTSGTGPTIELSIMDADLNARLVEGYARTLLTNSNLPL